MVHPNAGLMKLFKRRGSEDSAIDRAAERFLKRLKAKPVSLEEEEEQEPEAYSRDELQDMLVTDLWQIASNLGISTKGKESLIDMILEAQKVTHPQNLIEVVEGKLKDQQAWKSLDSIMDSALSLLEK